MIHMREILFKGKRIGNKEWVEGFYVKCRKHHYILPVDDCDHGFDERYMDWVEVDPETVCQYTGLTDKTGRKIWENDIIRYNKKLFRIAWEAECTHFAAYPLEDLKYAPCLNIGTMKSIEVVGNIFDNPEQQR